MSLFAVRMIIGVVMSVILLGIAARRLVFLWNLGRSGQPMEPGRFERYGGWGGAIKAEIREVLGQRKLLQWTGAGLAHFAVFWGFVVLLLTVIEGFGSLFDEHFQIPIIGNWPITGFVEDLFALMCLLAIVAFAVIRFRNQPKDLGRRSRFFGSHLGPAWFTLFMIFNVIWTLWAVRGAQINAQEVNEPDGPMAFLRGAFMSQGFAKIFEPLGQHTNEILETVLLLLALLVLEGFTIFVVHSKHLHIFMSLPNVAFARRPRALGATRPVYSGGKPVDFEDPGDDDMMGIGKVEDFTWKGLLDFATCTECGRCQSQCPAWNTGKPLSPKLLIMGLRDHALAKAPYILAKTDEAKAGLSDEVKAIAEMPLIGATEYDENDPAHTAYNPHNGQAAIDADVLWSCTTCGACVEQCPVDIEHVDHIIDMRRYQMLVESAFPEEAEVAMRGLEHAGDPWGRGQRARMEWAEQLDFEVPFFGTDGTEEDGKIAADIDYVYWVGCAGALDDGAQKTARAVATLLHEAGVKYVCLGEMETCTGDPARRIGHEFLFQMLAMQNNEVLKEVGADSKTIIVTCPHCYNALSNEYPQTGGVYKVVHHSVLLAQLVKEGRLTPVARLDQTVTYHDPCYLGRHNRIFAPPREVLAAVPGARVTEMERNMTRSFCCGAGGARMFMDENLGTRINLNRSDEALALKPDVVTAACPFCITMLTDGVGQRKLEGTASEHVEVLDVAELLLRSVKPEEVPAG